MNLQKNLPSTKLFSLICVSLLVSRAHAQSTTENSVLLPEITVESSTTTGNSDSDVSGFSGTSLRKTPLSVHIISADEREEKQIYRLSDITKTDASTTDSYNASGYWDIMAIRGYTLDNRSNYEREGLPINAETSIPLDNKERIEVLKGLSGLQEGVSAPGGMINYVVKRPTDKNLQVATMEVAERGDVMAGIDVGGHSKDTPALGYRLNLASEDLEPKTFDSSGSRSLMALANDWHFSSDSVLESEFEWSHRSQPSQAGFSLLGSTLPAPPDPRLNLNNQPWSQPVVFEGLTGSLRFRQNLNAKWRWSVIGGFQNLKTDDRLAYPFGCTKDNNFDRYCSDGTFDMYDYRSDNEKRNTQAVKTMLEGEFEAGPTLHKVQVGAMVHAEQDRFGAEAYNYVGSGSVQGTAILPASPVPSDPNTDRNSSDQNIFLSDNIGWQKWNLWLGLRFSEIHRDSLRTNGTQGLSYNENFTIPWGAVSYTFEEAMVYVSTGQGVESFVTPSKPGYDHPGADLSDVVSKEIEVGVHGSGLLDWNLAAFQIQRPVVTDLPPAYEVDGDDQHRGVEAQANLSVERWDFDAAAMLLEAKRIHSSLTPDLNNKRPTNVPTHTVRLAAAYEIPAVAGLQVNTLISQEGSREVTPDNTISIPTWTRWDGGLSYAQRTSFARFVWRFSVENLTDQRYWRESPTQYGHIYLYPGDSRTFRLSLQASL